MTYGLILTQEIWRPDRRTSGPLVQADVEYVQDERLRLICSKTEYMQMLAIRRISNLSGLLKALGEWRVLLLLILWSFVPCYAQGTSHCGHSTVEDTWGTTVASEAKSFLANLQRYVKTGDKKQFAALIHYPIRVLDGDHTIEVSSPSEFVNKYSSFITPDVKHAILTQSGSCLFANGQGMMVGRGQLWFQKQSTGDLRVITISLRAPRVGKQ